MTENNEIEPIPTELVSLRDSMRAVQPPASIEQALLREFRSRQEARRPSRGWRFGWAAVLAMATLVVAVLVLRPGPQPPEAVESAEQTLATDYIPIGYGQPLYPEEFVQVVRISVPRSEMVQFGLPLAPDAGPDRVMADVVVGEDGIARAIRFVE